MQMFTCLPINNQKLTQNCALNIQR